jgi:hypothetical protein
MDVGVDKARQDRAPPKIDLGMAIAGRTSVSDLGYPVAFDDDKAVRFDIADFHVQDIGVFQH